MADKTNSDEVKDTNSEQVLETNEEKKNEVQLNIGEVESTKINPNPEEVSKNTEEVKNERKEMGMRMLKAICDDEFPQPLTSTTDRPNEDDVFMLQNANLSPERQPVFKEEEYYYSRQRKTDLVQTHLNAGTKISEDEVMRFLEDKERSPQQPVEHRILFLQINKETEKKVNKEDRKDKQFDVDFDELAIEDSERNMQKCDLIRSSIELLETIRNNESFRSLPGVSTLHSQIENEITVQLEPNLDLVQVCSSNLRHYRNILSIALELPDCVAVLKVFGCKRFKQRVDIVSHNGFRWTKVITRNGNAFTGYNSSEYVALKKSAEKLQACARENRILLQNPQIVFHFCSEIEENAYHHFEELGVLISAKVRDHSERVKVMLPPDFLKPKFNAFNLDTSSMVAYVSNLTNGGCNESFSITYLNEQAISERVNPIADQLKEWYQAQLFCCSEVLEKFKEVVRSCGGPEEKKRAEKLMERISLVPSKISYRTRELQKFKNIEKSTLFAFGTGDAMGFVTISSNQSFYEKAIAHNIDFGAIIHKPRSLSERHEKSME